MLYFEQYGSVGFHEFWLLAAGILLLLVQKKNQEKDTRATCPFGYPALLVIVVSLKTRLAQTVQTHFSTITAMLGCVSMG